MPTGYTSDLYEGKTQTFPEFALRCARAFGATVTLRDEPLDMPIPDEFAPSVSHHDTLLAEAKARLEHLRSMSADACAQEANEAWERWFATRTETQQQRAALQDRYEAMLEQAKSWEPPTSEHTELRKFMISQLEESIRFDCGMDYYPDAPPLDVDEWRRGEIARATREIKYHTAERAKEVERAKSRTAWVRALRESLKVTA